MKKWNHFNFEQRKIIVSSLARKHKLIEIADLLDVDSSAISKEIQRNKKLRKKGVITNKVCVHTQRFPRCCKACPKKYSDCPYVYDAKHAQSLAERHLVQSREGLNMTDDEFNSLDEIIKEGIENDVSIYHIVHDNPDINVSVPTVYRLINDGKLTTKRMDLPYAVKYKQRKKLKQYEYKENNSIDCSKRRYIDFLEYIHNHRNSFHVQKDFLGSIRTDTKSILTMTIPDLHYVMLFLIDSPNQEKVKTIFDAFEERLSIKYFSSIFSCILTDRDPCFSNFNSIENATHLKTEKTRIFYCDSFNSSQKANVEQMNKQLRKYFPKGKTIEHHTPESVHEISTIINKSRIASLSGSTPNEAFVKIYGETVLNQLNSIII